MVLLDRPSDPSPGDNAPPITQERRNDVRRALFFMMAKRYCRGHALACFLDDAGELLPVRLEDAAPSPDDTLIVNSTFRYEPEGDLPPEIRHRPPPTDGLLGGFPLAWIESSGPGLWAPFWARGEWCRIFEALRPGQPAPSTLSPQARRTLAMAKILVTPGHEQRQRERWQATSRDAAALFQSAGYAIVRDLLPPAHIGALRKYYRALVAANRLPVGDTQVAERHRLHSEPVGMFLHPQLTTLVSRIAGEPVKPSYLYFSSYPAGSALPRHVDRIQCEFSISLLIDYAPEPNGPCGWPLFLEHPDLPGGVVGADLGLGDALLYRGRQLAHFRDRLPEGHQSSSLFLHYVREDFAGDTS